LQLNAITKKNQRYNHKIPAPHPYGMVWTKQGNPIKYSIYKEFKVMVKLLFVCHGNICRSPMAEFVMKDMVEKEGLSDQFEISSAATSTEEIRNGVGNPVYPPAKQIMEEHGIYCKKKRAQQMKKSDYESYDLLIGMDQANIRNMTRIAGGDPKHKIKRLLDYTDAPRDVADPWYTRDFQTTWRDVNEGCRALLEAIQEERK
jgi:protein-tyrosine phosphatase